MIPKTVIVRSFTCSNFLLATLLPFPRMLTGQNTMSLSAEKAPMAFILDFDGTITVKDTISVLGNFGVEWQAKGGLDVRGVWEEVVEAYGRDWESHVGGFKHMKGHRRTLDEEVRYQRSLKEVEEKSFGRASESELFSGIKKEDWETAGRQAVEKGDVIVRKGLRELINKLRERGDIWGIVSANFSGSFIRGVVRASTGLESEEIEVLANESDENGVLKGPKSVSGTVVATSDAKLAAMKDLLKSWSHEVSPETSRPIYIGDSGTDIECLIEPGMIGIVMSDDGNSSLMQTLQHIGWEVVHIGEYKSSSGRIYFARDFDEILKALSFDRVSKQFQI